MTFADELRTITENALQKAVDRYMREYLPKITEQARQVASRGGKDCVLIFDQDADPDEVWFSAAMTERVLARIRAELGVEAWCDGNTWRGADIPHISWGSETKKEAKDA